VSQVRSTLLSASLTAIRRMGWEQRYFAQLPASLHGEMRNLTAGFWVPVDIAQAHYTACDAMMLTDVEAMALGEDVSMKTQQAFIATLGKAAAGVGVTPWVLFQSVHRIWGRMVQGADTGVYKVGPKEALVCLVACSLADLRYFRVGLVGYYRAIARVVTSVAYAREVRTARAPGTLTFRLSWV
jgi:hypothetical protein